MTTTPAHAAMLDQVLAAADHAESVLIQTGKPRYHLTGGTSTWLARQRSAVIDSFRTGPIQLCEHIKAGPRIIHAAAWAPRIYVCTRCTPALAPPPGEEDRCDRCQRHHPVVHPGTAAIGPILFNFGLCPPCNKTEKAACIPNPANRKGGRQ